MQAREPSVLSRKESHDAVASYLISRRRRGISCFTTARLGGDADDDRSVIERKSPATDKSAKKKSADRQVSSLSLLREEDSGFQRQDSRVVGLDSPKTLLRTVHEYSIPILASRTPGCVRISRDKNSTTPTPPLSVLIDAFAFSAYRLDLRHVFRCFLRREFTIRARCSTTNERNEGVFSSSASVLKRPKRGIGITNVLSRPRDELDDSPPPLEHSLDGGARAQNSLVFLHYVGTNRART